MKSFLWFLLWGLSFSSGALASEGPPLDSLPGSELSVLWGVPFLGILLTLSLAPLVAPRFWHSFYGLISLFWALGVVFPMASIYGFQVTLHEIGHTYLLHFIPFIVLIGALYTISGGIKIDLDFPPSPRTNTLLLLGASVIASCIGTTGAAMLFIRPLLDINASRSFKTHTVIFFILLVCNIGGSLTALGDPPLFLGFLNGIDFFWPTKALFFPFVLISGPLLLIYFLLDTLLLRREQGQSSTFEGDLEGEGPEGSVRAGNSEESESQSVSSAGIVKSRFKLSGKKNLLFLSVALAGILLSGLWKSGISFSIIGIPVELESLIRDGTLLLMSWCSWTFGSQIPRRENFFTWEPLLEVTKLFAAIFITAAPVIAILQAGTEGSLHFLVTLVTDEGVPVNQMYFWLTGILSAFLDNAPTYLVFFNMAGGDPEVLMGPLSQTLVAISAGAVFMGALTYIGNAPNFMVKSIAESQNVVMPGFFGYMLWSFGILLPLFLMLTFVLFYS